MTTEYRGIVTEGEQVVNSRLDPKDFFPTPTPTAVESREQCTEVVRDSSNKAVYSVFTSSQKRAIVISSSFFGLLSYMSSSIYYPAVNQISRELHVSTSKINLTITMFLIAKAFAPTMIAEFSANAGRRPAYLVCFVVCIIANLGLALQNEYFALLFLRVLQSTGSCSVLSQGLVNDCVVSAERGKYIGYTSVPMVLGLSLSPVLGGLISQYAGWHWIFWFLLILHTATFIPLVLFLPETCRQLVGDGSIPPPRICNNITDSVRFKNRLSKGIPIDRERQAELRKNFRLAVPNPLTTVRILVDRESSTMFLSLSLAFACYYAIFTNISQDLHTLYGFSNTHVSLVILSVAGGSMVSAFTTGRLVDWNYRRHAKSLKFPVSRHRQMDLSSFPIELARLQIGLPQMYLGAIGVVGYGWTLNSRIPVAVPIVFLFIVGYGISATSQVLFVLMADIHQGQVVVAAAARNMSSCLVGAAASAAIEPMSQAMGNGWAYTVLASLFMLSLLGLIAIMRYGMEWRKEKREKLNPNI